MPLRIARARGGKARKRSVKPRHQGAQLHQIEPPRDSFSTPGSTLFPQMRFPCILVASDHYAIQPRPKRQEQAFMTGCNFIGGNATGNQFMEVAISARSLMTSNEPPGEEQRGSCIS